MLAADRPEDPEHREQLDEGAAVAVGERVAQLVGEVDLLGGERVDGRELVAAEEAGAAAIGGRERPDPPGRRPASASAQPRGPARASPSSPASTSCRRPNSRTVSSIRWRTPPAASR